MIEIDPKHPNVDFTKPIQFLRRTTKAYETDWVDCVLSEDGTTLSLGIKGLGEKFSVQHSIIRNTPMDSIKEIREEIQNRCNEIIHEGIQLIIDNQNRIDNVIYKNKTLP
jgi:hypothetical protein